MHDAVLERIAAALIAAQRVLFVTGAGLSADSGLPTYRGIGGLYEGIATAEGKPIEELLSGATFRRNPELTWKYLLQVGRACQAATFNTGHRVIAELERKLERVVVLTQNVDGFHQRAGSSQVIEIHGNLFELRCTRCPARRKVSSFSALPPLPHCACGGVERPDVVLFGENLSEQKMDLLMSELQRGFDVVISVGTSGQFPYIRLPMIRAQVFGWLSVDINPSASEMTPYARHHLPLRAAEACEALWSRVLGAR